MLRIALADVVEARLDRGETRFDERLELGVGEDVWPVVLDAFADELADVNGINALGNAVANPLDAFRDRAGSRYRADRPFEALGQIA